MPREQSILDLHPYLLIDLVGRIGVEREEEDASTVQSILDLHLLGLVGRTGVERE